MVQYVFAPGYKSRNMEDLKPTKEQQSAVVAFASKQTFKINAYAGTGKTATLAMMAHSSGRQGLYIAFNKSIADEAGRKFPSHVKALTSHSLAYRAVKSQGFSNEQMTKSFTPKALAYVMQLSPLPYGDGKRLTPVSVAYLVLSTLNKFSQSALEQVSPDLVPLYGYLAALSEKEQHDLQLIVCSLANKLWGWMIDPSAEKFPLGHNGYFKLWSLSKPTLNSDYCLLDEAQDSNPALLSVLGQQGCQVVYVGDRFQQIYGWRGAVNAMELVEVDATLQLSQSFRFGPAVADFATKVINTLDPSVAITGNMEISSCVGCADPDAILSRTNAQLIAYVIDSLNAGRLPHVVGGTSEMQSMLQDVGKLKLGQPATHHEFFGFRRWEDILEYVKQPEGQSLSTFVSIVEKHGEEKLVQELKRTQSEELDADLILSTAHKAKGREWGSVMVAEDFSEPIEVKPDNREALIARGNEICRAKNGKEYAVGPEEMRLLYVAATRAKSAVHLPSWCERFFGVKQSVEAIRFGSQSSSKY